MGAYDVDRDETQLHWFGQLYRSTCQLKALVLQGKHTSYV